MRVLIALFFIITLQSCGTIQYSPKEYEIANDRVQDLNVFGRVDVQNTQDDASERILWKSFVGDLKSVTEHFKTQFEKELSENSETVNADASKEIKVKVTELVAEQKIFHFVARMTFEFELGNGEFGNLSVSHGSPGNMYRVLNGAIALGVIDLLNNEAVREYLEGE